MYNDSSLTALHPDSFLAKVAAGQPLVNQQGKELLRQIPCKRWNIEKRVWEPTVAKIASTDNGNDAYKGAMLKRDAPQLTTVRIPTAYAPARELRGADRVLTWQVNDSEKFWIGDDALDTQRTESLPVGFTHERLPDARYQRFLAAAQVELLIAAGYGQRGTHGELLGDWQGEHDIYCAIGLPPEEVGREGPTSLAQEALRHIFNTPFHVRRFGEDGRVTSWTIRFVELVPYAQSFASFACWYYKVDGSPITTNIIKHVTLDIGGGQFHACEVDLVRRAGMERPKLRMTASQIGDGTIVIARGVSEAIRAKYYNIRLSDAEAQRVLINGTIPVGGRETPVDDIVRDVIISRAENLRSVMLPYLQEGKSFLMFTGGGSILLAEALRQIVSKQRLPEDYFFVPPKLSSVLNAIGGIVLGQASAQRAAQMQAALAPQTQV
jgi:hypothetical protein